jgi:transposase
VVPAAALHTGTVSATKQAHHAAVHALHAQGKSHRAIAALLGLHRLTVRRYLAAPEGLRPRVGRCAHEPYLPYLLQRWNEGCHNGHQLWREICAQGYTGAWSTLSPLFTQLRRLQGIPSRQRRPSPSSPPLTVAHPVRVRQIAFHFLRPPARLEADEQAYLVQLCAQDPPLAATYRLAQAFVHLLHERRGDALDAWTEEVAQQGTPHLQAFATGLRQDWAAVQAGLTLPWNNGRCEGLVNKLKMIKRQMFGRAGFPLLRQRVLHRRA